MSASLIVTGLVVLGAVVGVTWLYRWYFSWHQPSSSKPEESETATWRFPPSDPGTGI